MLISTSLPAQGTTVYEINTGQRDPYSATFIVRHVLQLRQVTRIPLGTPYPDIARQVRDTLKHPGGPGLPFIDFLRTEPLNASLIKLVITGSGSPHHTQDQYVVSRAHLLTSLALLLEHKVLQLPVNDDAMSLAMAAWQAARTWRGALARTSETVEPSTGPRR